MRKLLAVAVVLNLMATGTLFLLVLTPGSLDRLGLKNPAQREQDQAIDRHLRGLLGVNTMLYDFTPKPGQAYGKWCLYLFEEGERRRAFLGTFPASGDRIHRIEMEWEPATGRWMLWDGRTGIGGTDPIWKKLTSPQFSRQPGDMGREGTIDGMEVVGWAIGTENHDGKNPAARTEFVGLPNRRKYMAALAVKTFKTKEEAEAFEFPE